MAGRSLTLVAATIHGRASRGTRHRGPGLLFCTAVLVGCAATGGPQATRSEGFEKQRAPSAASTLAPAQPAASPSQGSAPPSRRGLASAEWRISQRIWEHLTSSRPGKSFVFSPHVILKGIAALLAASADPAGRDEVLTDLHYDGYLDQLQVEIAEVETLLRDLDAVAKRPPRYGLDSPGGPRAWFRYGSPAIYWSTDRITDPLRARLAPFQVEPRAWPSGASPDYVLRRSRWWLSEGTNGALPQLFGAAERQNTIAAALHLVAPWANAAVTRTSADSAHQSGTSRSVASLMITEDPGEYLRSPTQDGPAFSLMSPFGDDGPSLPSIVFFSAPSGPEPLGPPLYQLEALPADQLSAAVPVFQVKTVVNLREALDQRLHRALKGEQFLTSAALSLGETGINAAPPTPEYARELLDIFGAAPKQFAIDVPFTVFVWDERTGAVFYAGYVAEAT
jgi:hypothetical protein